MKTINNDIYKNETLICVWNYIFQNQHKGNTNTIVTFGMDIKLCTYLCVR